MAKHGASLNFRTELAAQIARLSPDVVRDGSIDVDLLRELLGSDAAADTRFGLTWPGKQDAMRSAHEPSAFALVPDFESSVDWETTRNTYIEGDNLEVLRILQDDYRDRIKMIYIDPPYNTGEDFVYRDNFRQSAREYRASGQVSDLDLNGRFHTSWLNMIYPRLSLARRLLTEDGAIFVSLDDNEVHHLQAIMREIFGDENVETLIWNKEAEGKSGTLKSIRTVRRIHEYVVVGYRDRTKVQFTRIREALAQPKAKDETANLAVNTAQERSDHPNYFTITNPSGDEFTRQWKWSRERIDELIEQDLIYWGADGHRQPRLIIPSDERRTTFLTSILGYGGTTVGRKDFERHFLEENRDPVTGKEKPLKQRISFDNPKPVILLRKLLETATDKDSIVLDFFSGSGSTAEAVMTLNAMDGGTRRHIQVQLPEETAVDSVHRVHGFATIPEIGRERIRRAGAALREECAELDAGFRAFKLSDGSFGTKASDADAQDSFTE